jgi:hypothetical protein
MQGFGVLDLNEEPLGPFDLNEEVMTPKWRRSIVVPFDIEKVFEPTRS